MIDAILIIVVTISSIAGVVFVAALLEETVWRIYTSWRIERNFRRLARWNFDHPLRRQ